MSFFALQSPLNTRKPNFTSRSNNGFLEACFQKLEWWEEEEEEKLEFEDGYGGSWGSSPSSWFTKIHPLLLPSSYSPASLSPSLDNLQKNSLLDLPFGIRFYENFSQAMCETILLPYLFLFSHIQYRGCKALIHLLLFYLGPSYHSHSQSKVIESHFDATWFYDLKMNCIKEC